MGVPTLACTCAVCTSADAHDHRLRPSVLLRWRDTQAGTDRAVVIDTGPDFRAQALRAKLAHVDAVFYTHGHADHILGLDDLRPLSFIAERRGGPIPLYADQETTAILRQVYAYTFSPHATYPTRARVELKPLAERNTIDGVEFVRIPLLHGAMPINGFRFGNAAYMTDVSAIPEPSFAVARGRGSAGAFGVASRAASQPRDPGAVARVGAAHRRPANLVHAHRARTGSRGNQPQFAGECPSGLRRVERARNAMSGEQSAGPQEAGAMQVFRSLAEIPAGFGPTVAAVGNFDGVHRGHREILARVTAEARSRSARAVAITFDPHPEQFLRPAQAPRLITPNAERLRLLAETGIDAALVLKFDETLANLAPRAFVEQILVHGLQVRSVHEGRNFRFGHGAAAGVEDLAAMGAELGFAVDVHEAVRVRGMEASSSTIRAWAAAGDVRRARWLLGRPFTVLSTQPDRILAAAVKALGGLEGFLMLGVRGDATFDASHETSPKFTKSRKVTGRTVRSQNSSEKSATFRGLCLSVRQEELLDVLSVALEQHIGAAQIADLLVGTLDHAVALAALGIDHFAGAGQLEALLRARTSFSTWAFARLHERTRAEAAAASILV